jgi:hypothetical protein
LTIEWEISISGGIHCLAISTEKLLLGGYAKPASNRHGDHLKRPRSILESRRYDRPHCLRADPMSDQACVLRNGGIRSIRSRSRASIRPRRQGRPTEGHDRPGIIGTVAGTETITVMSMGPARSIRCGAPPSIRMNAASPSCQATYLSGQSRWSSSSGYSVDPLAASCSAELPAAIHSRTTMYSARARPFGRPEPTFCMSDIQWIDCGA